MRLGMLCFTVGAMLAIATGRAAADPTVLHLDYGSFNPLSIVLKNKHWVEQALGDDFTVEWVEEVTTARTLDRLRVRSIDIGSAASAGTLLQKAAGTSVKIVYVYSRPHWTGLVTLANSSIASVADLKGKRVAASIRTEPGIFLLHALADAGMQQSDIIWVPLHDMSGRMALDLGQVDAWAGFDPFMAQAELENADKVFFQKPEFDSYGVLDVRQTFLDAHADVVQQVVRAYEKARLWVLANQDETIKILGSDGRLSPTVASKQLGRTDFSDPNVDDGLKQSLAGSFDVLKSNGLIPADADLNAVTNDLLDSQFTDALKRQG